MAHRLTTGEVRDQFSAYEDPRGKSENSYDEYAEQFDAWLESVKQEARNEASANAAEKLDKDFSRVSRELSLGN